MGWRYTLWVTLQEGLDPPVLPFVYTVLSLGCKTPLGSDHSRMVLLECVCNKTLENMGMQDGFAWLLVDGLGMHSEWSCDDDVYVLLGDLCCVVTVSIWNDLMSICSDLLVPLERVLLQMFPFSWGWGWAPIPSASGCGLSWLPGIFSALLHAAVCSVATFMGVRGGAPIPAARGCWLALLPGVCCALFYAVVHSVMRLSVIWSMCYFPWLLLRLLASIRAWKVMPCCLNKFGNFGVGRACFCMQVVHVVKCTGKEYCPWGLGIALLCHCGLKKVNFVCNVPMVL